MNIKYKLKLRWVCCQAIAATLGCLTFATPSALSAEKVKLIYGPFSGRVSLSSIEKYATTGEMNSEFRLYSKFVKRDTLTKLRQWLNNRFQSDRVAMYKFTRTPEGEKFLQELGTVIKTHPQRNGFYAIRAALIEAADKPGNSDGWTIMEAMQNFPTDDLQINTKKLFRLQKSWSENPGENQAALEIFTSTQDSLQSKF
ncbi:MAG: alpha/beta hydrolase [Cyanobacteria bacterium J06621_8]